MMLAKVAWKNIWRRPLRSLLLVLAIVVGVWAGTFTMGFYSGLNEQRIRDKVENRLSHVQIHHPAFVDETDPLATLPAMEEMDTYLHPQEEVKAWSGRAVFSGMVRTAHSSNIITLNAIDPAREKEVTAIHRQMVAGDYFAAEKKLPVVLGYSLARQLQVEVDNSVVLDFQYPAGVFQSLKAKVVGIYQTNDSRFDAQQVYVPHLALENAGVLQPSEVHEVGVLLHHGESAEKVSGELQQGFPSLRVREWKQVAPELSYIHDYHQLSMSIFMAVVMIAVGFVIVNTLLMVVLERSRELRMLRAVGMKGSRVFWMVQMETLMLALISGPLGALLGWGTVTHFGNVGIHVSSLEEGLSAFGVSSAIHPALELRYYLLISLGIMLTSLLAAAYPAFRAARSRSGLSRG